MVVLVIVLFGVTQYVAPTPTGYASKTENVEFYPACGSGPITVGKLTWYPISREDWPTPDTHLGVAFLHLSGGRGIAASVADGFRPTWPG